MAENTTCVNQATKSQFGGGTLDQTGCERVYQRFSAKTLISPIMFHSGCSTQSREIHQFTLFEEVESAQDEKLAGSDSCLVIHSGIKHFTSFPLYWAILESAETCEEGDSFRCSFVAILNS